MKKEILAARPAVPPFTRETAIQKVRLSRHGEVLLVDGDRE